MKSKPTRHRVERAGLRWTAALAAALAGALALAAGSGGEASAATEGSRQTASFEFTTKRPDRPAGAVLTVDYVNPEDPDAKPPAVRRVVTTLAPGARYDTSVPARCKASDAELMVRGEAACPPESKVGVGSLTVDTGFPGPGRFLDVAVDFFNETDELIFLNTETDSGARTVLRAPIRGRRIVSDVPPLPGTPPDGGAITSTDFEDFRIADGRGPGRRAYIRTPPRCPASGYWRNRVTFTYSDGVTQAVTSRSPCRPAPACRGEQATLVGTRADDLLRGTPGRDVIVARRGGDTIRGRGGGDLICSGRGADDVGAGRGADRVYGGRGADVLRGGRGADSLHGGRRADTLHGGRGRDRLFGGRGADDMRGGLGRDRCRGSQGRDEKQSCER